MSLLKDVLKAVAPTLGAAVGGPAGALVGKALSRALGTKEGAKDEDLARAVLEATPEQLLALKKEEHDFEVRMAELGIKPQELEASDRASARQMHMATHDRTPAVLSWVVTVGFFATLVVPLLFPVPVEGKELFTRLCDRLTDGWMLILAFWFGTSFGSRVKDGFLGQAVNSGGEK